MIERRPNFTLLRLLLAAGVIVSHAFELVDGDRSREPLTRLGSSLSLGEIAVTGFFLLSGYLITQSWQQHPHPADFLRKRVLRIYPAFIIATAVGALVVGPLGTNGPDYWSTLNLRTTLWDALLLRPTQTPPVFAGLPYPVVNGAMWTIRYEFALYLLVPLLLWPRDGRRSLWLVVTAAALLLNLRGGIALPGLQSQPNAPLVRHATAFLRLAPAFLVGGTFYLWRDRITPSRRLDLLAAAAIAAMLPFPRFAETALVLGGGYLLIRVASRKSATSSNPPDLSYGLYLYAWPIQQLLHWHAPSLSPVILLFATLGLGLIAGWVSWTGVEAPALRLRPHPRT